MFIIYSPPPNLAGMGNVLVSGNTLIALVILIFSRESLTTRYTYLNTHIFVFNFWRGQEESNRRQQVWKLLSYR